jgi:hypothetical protein
VTRAYAALGTGLLAAIATTGLARTEPAAGEPVSSWSDLTPSVAIEHDPFVAMAFEDREALRDILRVRLAQEAGQLLDASTVAHADRLAAGLAARGLDVPALFATRHRLMQQRRAAAEQGVPALDGEVAMLTGYLLATSASAGDADEFVLVPTIEGCSHTAPPAPNQIVRLRAAQPIAVAHWYQPARVSGRLLVRPERGRVFRADGISIIQSTYAIDGALIEPLTPTAAATR